MPASSCGSTVRTIRRICTCLSILLLGFTAARATGNDAALWQKANTFYSQKKFDSAGIYYARLLQKYPRNAQLHYNAGNACYRLNEVGKAILHYEKAAFLDPGNKQVTDNLLLAKGRVQNPVPEATPIFFVTWWDNLLHAFSSNTWAVLCLAVFMGILVLVYFARVRKERFTHSGRWLSLGIVSLLVCGCMAWFSYDASINSGKAVILVPGTPFTDAPKGTGKVLGSLPEGTVVEINQEEGNFINVKLPNGREGWIPAIAISGV